MGGLSRLFSGFMGSIIKPLSQSEIRSVGGPAATMLKGITDGFVSKGAEYLKGVLNASSLPGPFKAMGDKLIGRGADYLRELGGGIIDRGLAKLMDMVTKRQVDGIGDLNVPGLGTASRQAALQNNSPVPLVGTSRSAATGGTNAPRGAAGTAKIDRAPNPDDYDMSSVKGQAKFNADMLSFQMSLTNMQNYYKAQSDIHAGQKEVQSKMSGNLR